MKHKWTRLAISVAAMLGATVAAPVMTPGPADAATCGISPTTDVPETGHFLFEGVNIRSGPGTNCVSRGLGYSSHNVTYHCWQSGDIVNGYSTWTYLTDNSTGVSGWSSDQYLSNFGSQYHC